MNTPPDASKAIRLANELTAELQRLEHTALGDAYQAEAEKDNHYLTLCRARDAAVEARDFLVGYPNIA